MYAVEYYTAVKTGYYQHTYIYREQEIDNYTVTMVGYCVNPWHFVLLFIHSNSYLLSTIPGKRDVELTPEQPRFELCRSTYKQILFNKYSAVL